MYLHMGGGVVVRSDELVGIFDLDAVTRGKSTREFLQSREKDGRLISAHGGDLPRAFALTRSDTAILSPITTETLYRKLSGR